jgi:hypothetical protein
MRARITIALLAASLVVSAAAARADDVSALYSATWAGLPAATISLSLHDGGGAYRDQIAIGSEGLPHIVTHFRGTAITQGKIGAGNAPSPDRFDANYDLRKRKNRELRMNFVARDGATVAERGPGDTSRKPELKEQFRRDVIDPLSVITAIRAAGIHLALLLRAIAGFKGESSDDPKEDPDDAPRPVSLTLSDDGKLTPLSMTVKIWFLPLTATLERLCAPGGTCAW